MGNLELPGAEDIDDLDVQAGCAGWGALFDDCGDDLSSLLS